MARSEPFILDSTTGEPTIKVHTYERYQPWKLIVKDQETGKRKVKLYWTYAEAKQRAEGINENHGERVEAHVVSRQLGYGPPYSKISDLQLLELNEKGRFWCPYCRKLRRFLWASYRGKNCCEFCRTADTDFHVIRNNPLWWDPDHLKNLLERRRENA